MSYKTSGPSIHPSDSDISIARNPFFVSPDYLFMNLFILSFVCLSYIQSCPNIQQPTSTHIVHTARAAAVAIGTREGRGFFTHWPRRVAVLDRSASVIRGIQLKKSRLNKQQVGSVCTCAIRWLAGDRPEARQELEEEGRRRRKGRQRNPFFHFRL
jgi:hypothetical protein